MPGTARRTTRPKLTTVDSVEETAAASTEETAANYATFLKPVTSPGVQRKSVERERKPILTLDAVKAALEDGEAKRFVLPNEAVGKDVVKDLQRAATALDCSVSKSLAQENGQWVVDFRATHEKRKQSYSAQDIRDWWVAQGNAPLDTKRRIPLYVREQFKAARKAADSE